MKLTISDFKKIVAGDGVSTDGGVAVFPFELPVFVDAISKGNANTDHMPDIIIYLPFGH